ncbi:hypothetical protein ACVWWI_006723 [Bradyrhizobium sp. USDA 3686]|uniref:hypothetical protein n=1 Tax=Bradyrhizobium TaxID=374 RepID=UPI00195DCCC9|nr:hypothetical protein [Bradyrhizobium canariense]MBM7487720.1 hypothetical protein [Bradyrhizobium canariense]UFW71473.1 hypothetical protein BcanWU425_33450 [Bradyrhizobium canariense]
MSKPPLILAIDDDENEVRPKIPDGYALEVVDPKSDREVFAQLMSKLVGEACLILLDQKFHDTPISISLDAQDGSSFVSHLRSWSRFNKQPLAPIIMFTNDVEVFANEVPAVGPALPVEGSFVNREHRLAPALDVEWILFKNDERATQRLANLAEAFQEIRDGVGNDGASLDEILQILNAPTDCVWSEQAGEELQNARPPVDQTEEGTSQSARGASQIMRWLCHKALPYPGVFLSDFYAAWALGISAEDFRKIADLAPSTDWLAELKRAKYTGPLESLMGRRWWRPGIDQLVWLLDEATAKSGTRLEGLGLAVPGFQFGELKPSSSHVVICDEDLLESEIGTIEEAIQVHPPGWPAEALEPWMLKAEVKADPVLTAMADPNDLV